MKIKVIQKTIRSKMHEWLKTIDEPLRSLIKDKVIVTGGCITSMLLKEKINDYDVYFKDSETVKRILEFYKPKFEDWSINDKIVETDESWSYYVKSSGMLKNKAESVQGKYGPHIATANAITLWDKVQLITRFCGSPEQIHANFDFLHCMNYWTFKDGLVLNKGALAMTLTKELRYIGSRFPLCSLIRTKKFIQRDWTVNAGQYLKMAMQLDQLDLLDPAVLEDQLTGVDTAYFTFLITQLSKLGNYNTEGVMQLIDSIFDMVISPSEIEESSL